MGAAIINALAAVVRKNSRLGSPPRAMRRGMRRIKGKDPIRRAVRIKGRVPTQVRPDGADVTSAAAGAEPQVQAAAESADRRDRLRVAVVFDRYPFMVRATVVTKKRCF